MSKDMRDPMRANLGFAAKVRSFTVRFFSTSIGFFRFLRAFMGSCRRSRFPWVLVVPACEYISALPILSRDTAGIGGFLEMTGLKATPVAKMSLSFVSTCGVSLLCRFLSSGGLLLSFSFPFLPLNVSQ